MRKDDDGVQKLNGREPFPLSLQQWFIFLIALSELSFVSVIAASLYLDENINPGGTRRNQSPYTLTFIPEATVQQPETEINVNISPIAMFFRKQSFISLSYLDRDKNEFLIRRRLRTCYFCTLSGKLENLVSVTKCNSSSSMHSIAQMLCVEHEALTVNFGSLEGSWLKKPVHWEMGVGELMNTHFCLSNSVRCRDKEYLLFQIGWNG